MLSSVIGEEKLPLPKIEMYSSAYCPFCWGAQRLLKTKGVAFTLYSVDGEPKKRIETMKRGGGRTVPQVFIDDRPVGGFDELTALDMDGELDAMLGLNRRPPA